MVVVEVRQANTVDRESQLSKDDEDDKEDEEERGRGRRRRRRRREQEEEEQEEQEEEEATDIKSNNPHLAGGEKKYSTSCPSFLQENNP